MSESRPRGMHGMHGGRMGGEKAKDFKGSIGKLIRYDIEIAGKGC